MKLTFGLAIAAILLGLSPTVQGQDSKTEIQKRLEALFILTTIKDDRSDLVKAGSIVELHKDGLLMWSVDTAVPPICILKNDKLTMPFGLRANVGAELRKKQPGANDYKVPSRTFVAGEKVWIVGAKVNDNGVIMEFYSDPYQDVRYYGEVWFQFPKGAVPAADDFMKNLAEVVTALPPPEETETTQPAAPASTPPVVAPVAPPAAPTKTVSLGQTKDQVITILGQPPKIANVGTKEIDYYPDMKIIYINGRVTDIE
jgi:hypothetical protein